jgi:hypothetical protein
MGVTEEGISMIDENKNKAGLPNKKVISLFALWEVVKKDGVRSRGFVPVYADYIVIVMQQ